MGYSIWWVGTFSEPAFDISLGDATWLAVSLQWHNASGYTPTGVSSPQPSKKW